MVFVIKMNTLEFVTPIATHLAVEMVFVRTMNSKLFVQLTASMVTAGIVFVNSTRLLFPAPAIALLVLVVMEYVK